MFTYWRGYEIDGSSTTYNIIIPQRELAAEVLRYFLQLKIIDRRATLCLSYGDHLGRPSKRESFEAPHSLEEIEKICEVLERPAVHFISLSTLCVHPDRLFPQVRQDLYDLTKIRPGAEQTTCDYKNPTVSSLYNGPSLEVHFDINFHTKPQKGYEPEGLILNREALVQNMGGQHFTINFDCGPGFIFEYAAYIVTKMAERFPEIGIDGGVDCAGGFVDGCTYASSLYSKEKITLKTENIAEAIQTLLADGLLTPQKRTGKYGNDLLASNDLFLFNLHNVDKWSDDYLEGKSKIIKGIASRKNQYTPQEYAAYVRKLAEIKLFLREDIVHYSACALKLEDLLCALNCTKEAGRVWLELRVPPELRARVLKRLNQLGLDIR